MTTTPRTVAETTSAAKLLIRSGASMQVLVTLLGEKLVAPAKIGDTGIGLQHLPTGELIDLTWSFDQV